MTINWVIIIIIKLNSEAIRHNTQISHLNQLEQLLPKEVTKLSSLMIKESKSRIPKIKNLKSPLPSNFQADGSIIIRDYYFDTIINALNHVVSNQYKGNNYKQIKNSIRFLMTSVNHSDKHVIASLKEKSLLIKIIKPIKTSAHFNNLNDTINNVIHVISQCLVLNQESYHDYHFLTTRFNKIHNN